VVDERSGSRPPVRAGVGLVPLGGVVAKELKRVAALDKGFTLGEQAFEFDRTHFGAVLFTLAAALGLLVVVEGAFHALHGAME